MTKRRKLFGWIGSVLLSLCAIPQVWYTLRTGDATGLSWGFLLMWYIGEINLLWYSLPFRSWPLMVNYMINIVCVTLLLIVKIGEL
jgi:uncharacterized protein with PQ loop repeat